MKLGSSSAILALLIGVAYPVCADEAKDALIVETILRLENFDYSAASEKVQSAVGRYLDKSKGSDQYFDLVRRFEITDQIRALASLASLDKPSARAAELLVKFGQSEGIKTALAAAGERRDALIASLGTVNQAVAVEALVGLLSDAGAQSGAAKALSGSPAGQAKLLELAEAGSLPTALEESVAIALASSVDPAVRERASKTLKMPSSAEGELAAVEDLAKMKGDPGKGEAIFNRACISCHKVADKGIDFGQGLEEIGNKLAREALYEAILNPSGAISFGYEGFVVATRSGASYVGFIASDGEDKLGLKVPGGTLVSLKRGDIASQIPLPVSLMPTGLAATMNQADLVDLVEYLTTLKKK